MTEDESWTLVDSAALSGTVPWRTFRWYKGQRHYSGTYWSSVMSGHVIYESRLELTRLLYADFDRGTEQAPAGTSRPLQGLKAVVAEPHSMPVQQEPPD